MISICFYDTNIVTLLKTIFMAKKKIQKQNTILLPENYIRQRSRNLELMKYLKKDDE